MAFDASTDALLILDEQFKVRWANQRSADQWAGGLSIVLPGKRFQDLILLQSSDGNCLDANHPEHPIQRLQAGDGSGRFLIATGRGSSADDFKPHQISWRQVTEVPGGFVLVSLRDLEPAEQALLAEQNFLNQLAHELRTPLAIIIGCLQRAERSRTQKSRSPNHELEIAKQEAQRISHLLEQLSILSQLDHGSYPWHMEQRSFRSFLETWVQTLSEDSKKKVRLELNELDNSFHTKLDQQALNRVLDQLLSNSIRFSAERSRVVIACRHWSTTHELQLEFMDWGIGIPDGEEESIFERFKRLETYRQASLCEGPGLGLTIARKLMQKMGGSASVLPRANSEDANGPKTVIQLMFPCTR